MHCTTEFATIYGGAALGLLLWAGLIVLVLGLL